MVNVVIAVFQTLLSFECVRTLQCANYKVKRGYFKVVFTKYYLLVVLANVVALVFDNLLWLGALVTVVLSASLLFVKHKCPLVFTKRVVRLLVVESFVNYAVCYFFGGVVATTVINVLVAHFITLPVEKVINGYYVGRAKRKLASSNVKVIAVTGSYGKTSVKDMLQSVLPRSVATSGNFNTMLGIAKFVNSVSLDGTDYVILEFGAREIDDVKKLCNVYKPSYGIVTGVCAQHLSTFKTLENVTKAKRALVNGLPSDGICVLNANDEIVKGFETCGNCTKVASSTVGVSNVSLSTDGVSFDATFGGEVYRKTFSQLSLAVCDNFQMVATLALQLGVPFKDVVNNAKCYGKSRMELTFNGSFYILDDSYNASVSSVENCVKTLELLGKRVVAVTQGIVENGKEKVSQNVYVGKLLSQVCVACVVLGKNADSLEMGIDGRCPCERATSLGDAVTLARKYLMDGDVLLFQNDLPDNVNL